MKDRQFIANKAKVLNIPVVSINYPLSYAYEIGTDNASAIHTLMDYLTNEKNVKSTVFICGRKNSEEAKERKNAYLFYCQNHHINNLGCYGKSWDSDDGERTAEEFIHSIHPLPDCFICANDNNARAFINVLKRHGIRVPEDVFVTGFDNQDLHTHILHGSPQLIAIIFKLDMMPCKAYINLHKMKNSMSKLLADLN